VLHFRFAYRIACKDGVDWFERLSNDAFARQNNFHELKCLLMSDPFSVKIFEGFVNVSYFGLCLD